MRRGQLVVQSSSAGWRPLVSPPAGSRQSAQPKRRLPPVPHKRFADYSAGRFFDDYPDAAVRGVRARRHHPVCVIALDAGRFDPWPVLSQTFFFCHCKRALALSPPQRAFQPANWHPIKAAVRHARKVAHGPAASMVGVNSEAGPSLLRATAVKAVGHHRRIGVDMPEKSVRTHHVRPDRSPFEQITGSLDHVGDIRLSLECDFEPARGR